MACQDLSFGSFSDDEVVDLYTKETSDLQFVWQNNNSKLRCNLGSTVTPSKTQLLTIPSLAEREARSFSPDVLSPNIPPNPPTSPVEGPRATIQDPQRLPPRKLNVNAIPFIPKGPQSADNGARVAGSKRDESSLVSAKYSSITKDSNGTKDSNNAAKDSNDAAKDSNVDAPRSTTVARQLDFSSSKDTTGTSSERSEFREDSECSEGDKTPWPNLMAIQTSGQVTSASRTSGEGRGQDEGKLLSDILSSPDPSVTSEGCVNIEPPDPRPLSGAPDDEITAISGGARTEMMSPPGSSGKTTPTSFRNDQSDLSTRVNSHSAHERGGEYAPAGVSSIDSQSGSKTTPTTVTPIIISTVDQAQLDRTLSVTTPTDTPTSPTSSSNVDNSGPGPSSSSSNHSSSHPCSELSQENKPSSPEPASESDHTPSATPTTPATPTSSGGTAKPPGPQVKSWASIVSRTGTNNSSSPAQPGTEGASKVPASALPARTSGTKQAAERRCKEVITGANGAGLDRGVKDGAGVARTASSGTRTGGCVTQLKLLGEQLERWDMSHRHKCVQPRGLVNQGNWCYMHAPLQALLSVPSFLSLFKLFNPNPPLTKDPSATPCVEAMIQFVHEFRDYPRTASANSTSGPSARKKRPHQNDLVAGDPFRPDYVYEMLQAIRSNLSYRGRQEDAEEFLGCILDGLHEELVSACKSLKAEDKDGTGETVPHNSHPSPSPTSSSSSPELTTPTPATPPEGEGAGEEEWEQVGPKNKSTITRQTSFSESPITEIFGGQLRSALHRQGAKESATFEPFFSLQLDIQSEAITSVKDALDALTAKETVHMSEVDAYKRLTLARLPPVLIFHLKRFIFTSSGSQKLFKHIHYSTEMELTKELLAPAVKTKLSQSQRTYRLWAVVYHHGKSATGGHYTSDVYHSGFGGWIRVDDSLLKPIPEDFVLTPGGGVVNKNAYLLFYRRLDTVRS